MKGRRGISHILYVGEEDDSFTKLGERLEKLGFTRGELCINKNLTETLDVLQQKIFPLKTIPDVGLIELDKIRQKPLSLLSQDG